MKIYKKNDVSLLIKIFGIKDQLYLTTTVLIYFDLNDPDNPLKEQDLWKTIPDEIGQGQALDVGMPKPRGEVLVTGKCYAPKGDSRRASQVSVRVGAMRKALNIYGHRFWKGVGGTLRGITDPDLFTEMPITYENAFGGDGFEQNPLGKGYGPITTPAGEIIHPLPNIEHPDRLIGSPTDAPDPAGFGPLDMMWPPRSKKAGTYDEKWQQERWPHFPDDMNYEFFNVAPEDQYLSDYFHGNEKIEIINMHPDLPVINSQLPLVRARCFVTKKKSLKAADREEDIFQEVRTRVDTVWLFPDILRGLVMYRGSVQVLDDEYADIDRIFLATEGSDQKPKPIEYYYEEQKKAADRSVPIDPEPFKQAQGQLDAALKVIRNIPKDLERIKLKAMGKAPRMQRSLSETTAIAQDAIGNNLATLTELETMARGMQAQYGHLVKIDLDMFNRMRGKAQSMSRNIEQTAGKLKKTQQEMEAVKQKVTQEVSQSLKANVSSEDLQKAGVDPDNLDQIFKRTVSPWHDRGFPLVVQWRKNLERDQEALGRLSSLGFDRRTIRRAWLGVNPKEETDDPTLWGLTEGKDQAEPLVLPSGLVMPRFEEAILTRICIRTGKYSKADGDAAVQGSDETPLALLAGDGAPVIRVADELEAWLVEQEVGDICSVMALKDPGEKPGKAGAKAIEEAPVFLVVLGEKAAASPSDQSPWAKTFPNARELVLPAGENLFEARREGTDIRRWILEALPDEIGREHMTESIVPPPGQPPGPFKMPALPLSAASIQGMVEGMIKEVMAFHQPQVDELKALQSKTLDEAKEAITKAGLDPDEVMAAAKSQPGKSLAEVGGEAAKKIEGQKEGLRAAGLLTPEVEGRMNAAQAKVLAMGQKGEAQLQEGLAKIEAGKKEIAAAKAKAQSGEMPESAKQKLKEAGLDPDRMKKRTREEVVEMHGRGESLSDAILDGVDLSGLELPGIDLSRARCKNANFSGTVLDGAVFVQTIAMGADFSKASLKKVKMEKGLFMKAVFKGADLGEANIQKSMLKKADLTEADLTGAVIDMSMLQQAKLVKARLIKADVNMSLLSEADATETNFSGSRFSRCLFKGTILDRAVFSNAAVNSTMFYRAKGEKVDFTGADMDKARMGGNTEFPKADFRNTSMHQACCRESDLNGAHFEGSVLDEAIFESCNLAQATFYRVSAKKTRFNKSNLEGANMTSLNLFMGSLRKARLVDTNLRASNLFAVDFYKAVFGRTKLDGANMKRTQLFERTDLLK